MARTPLPTNLTSRCIPQGQWIQRPHQPMLFTLRRIKVKSGLDIFYFLVITVYRFRGGGDVRIPGMGDFMGDHFADWIHISVKLASQGGEYVPIRYYFSAHKTGEAFKSDDPDLDFYLKTGPMSFKEADFAEAKSQGEYHVGVFVAHGTHETYAERGNHHSAIDHTDFGNYVLVPMAWDMNPSASSNSKLNYPPYYAWDMSAVRDIDRDSRWDKLIVDKTIPYVSKVPLDLFAPLWDTSTRIWFMSTDKGWKAIFDSGQKDEGASAFIDGLVLGLTFGQVDLGRRKTKVYCYGPS